MPDVAGASVRTFRTGDMGLIAARQAILYAETQGWGHWLEANVAQTVADFLKRYTPGRDQAWVAELDGAMAGSVLLTDEGGGLARLRLLYVEQAAQGRGIGRLLVGTCLAFARAAGYRGVTLWTHTVLAGARHLYQANGFRLTETAMHEVFGVPVQGETWMLDLTRAPGAEPDYRRSSR